MTLDERARLHRALGDQGRLRIVDALLLEDRTPTELGDITGLPSNLLAHHLLVLEDAGLLIRHESEGDRRRRYLSLQHRLLAGLVPAGRLTARSVLFVCTHNSARSQFAEAVMASRTNLVAQSAGTRPVAAVHPKAISAAAEMGFDLSTGRPKTYGEIVATPDLVISVCDRAREAPRPFGARSLHWSVPDPVEIDRIDAFRNAFRTIEDRIDRLVEALQGGKA